MTNLNKKLILQIGNIIGFIATIIVNSLANVIPIGYGNTGELSDALPNLFVPAGLTFSIWGVIYALLALFSIYQARDLIRKEKLELEFLDKISYLFIILNKSKQIISKARSTQVLAPCPCTHGAAA